MVCLTVKIDVELKNVTKKFGDVVAVDDVSLWVGKCEFFSLLGPSGCGKTTTLRMISGFEKPTEGEVYIGGELMTDVPPFKRPTNLIFQNLALFPHLNVYDNISFGLKIKKLPKDEIQRKVKEMLNLVRLSGYEKRKIKQLSGGEQQRIAIVRALVNEPTVLLLDEPLGPLDLKLREEMVVELKRIQREVGTTFIYVTHDQGEALTMSDRIAVMKDGRVLQIGTPMKIYEQPKSRFIADFIGRSNLFEGSCADGVVEVDGLGRIIAEPGPQTSDKHSVLICAKPEKISIGRKLKGLDNIFDGEVKETYYQGRVTTYRVLLENGSLITVVVLSSGAKDIFKPGAKVKVGWNKRDVNMMM
ncbi:MAG: ABC transporter ATP-binding protein [Candidatus Bathyarchaeota archaeon]|nr:MAG: ABC transporter ATP-binding protein [Candidatus Bathyarchaeota archaeon]